MKNLYNRYPLFLLVLLFLFYFSELYPNQHSKFTVKKPDVDNGLIQSSILSLHEDSFGLIWIGTRDGLNRYNSINIKTYRHDPLSNKSIPGNVINAISDAENSNLWIAHNKGISLFERKTESFINFQPAKGLGRNPELKYINVIDDRVWVCGWAGTFFYDKTKDAFIKPEIQESGIRPFAYSASFIERDQNGYYWLGTTSEGLFQLDYNLEIINHFNNFEIHNNQEPMRFECILINGTDQIYLGTYGDGVIQLDSQGNMVDYWNNNTLVPSKRLDNSKVRAIEIDNNGVLWVGTFNGIKLIDLSTGDVIKASQLSGRNFNYEQSIRSLIKDNNGTIWIGTYHDGVWIFNDYFNRFNQIPLHTSNQSISSKSGFVSSIATHSEGFKFVGTEGGDLFLLNEFFEVLFSLKIKDPNSKEQITIKSLFWHEEKNKLYVGTLSHGIISVDLMENNTLLVNRFNIIGKHNAELLGVINQIQLYEKNLLLIASDKGGGISLLDIEANKLVDNHFINKIKEQILYSSVNHIAYFNNSLIIGTKGAGLLHFDLISGQLKKHLDSVGSITYVIPFSKGWIICTKNEGVFLLNSDFTIKKQLTTNDGLWNNSVLIAQEIEPSEIWFACLNGLSRYNLSNNTFNNYHYNNGFPIKEIGEKAFVFDRYSSKFITGGINGLTSFQSFDLIKNPNLPDYFIDGVYIFNDPVNQIEKYKFYDPNIKSERLVLKHFQNSITIEIASLNYLMPENNRYQFWLKGLDYNWRTPTHNTSISFNNLKPGSYTLFFRVANNDGIWNPNPGKVEFQIRPPVWQTTSAYILYLLIFLTGFYLFRKNLIKTTRLKQEYKLNKILQVQKEEVYQMKINSFTDISHEIKTPITLLLNPLEDILESKKITPHLRKKMVGMQYQLKNLLHLIDQLLEIKRAESLTEVIDLQPVSLYEYLNRIADSFQSIADANEIHFKRDFNIPDKPILLDKDKFEKILLNLLSNAFKFTEQNGIVNLFVGLIKRKETNILKIIIKDTGHGIEAVEIPKIFDRFYKAKQHRNKPGSGIGLALVKNIVEVVLQGRINVVSKPGKGSSFTVLLPNIRFSEKGFDDNNSQGYQLLSHDIKEPYLIGEKRKSTNKSRKKSILIVEDNEELLQYLFSKLSADYNVEICTNAEDGKTTLLKDDINLVISDIMLPGIDGLKFCNEIKKDFRICHIPIILLTARQDSDIKIESLRTGADYYLPKPFNFKELELIIRNFFYQQVKLQDYYSNNQTKTDHNNSLLGKYDKDLLIKIDNYIEKNLNTEGYSVDDLSKDVYMSRTHLFRKLKAIAGKSPSAYIREYRIKKAANILKNDPSLRVSEVAYSVGFLDTDYFTRCFKKILGKTPSQYLNN